MVTEDDYIDYLAQTELAAVVPVSLAAKLRRSHFLFLGYTMADWNLRVVLDRLWGDEPLSYHSWAVQPSRSRSSGSSGGGATSTSSSCRSSEYVATSAATCARRPESDERRRGRRARRTRASRRSRTPSSTPCSSSAASASGSDRREPARVAADGALRAERRRQELAAPRRRRASPARRCRSRAVVVVLVVGRRSAARARRRRRRPPGTSRRRRARSPRRSRAAPQAVGGDVYICSISSRSTSSTTGRGGPGRSRTSSPAAVREPGLRVELPRSALREDALAKLDAFKARIPNLFANYLRLDHLDRDGGARGDPRPDRALQPLRARRVEVEPELVDAVLDQVAGGGSTSAGRPRGRRRRTRTGSRRRTCSSCSSGSGRSSARRVRPCSAWRRSRSRRR